MNILVTSLSCFSVEYDDKFIHKSTYSDVNGKPLCEAYHSGITVCRMLVDRLFAKGEKIDII